jgi:hypothetical protein
LEEKERENARLRAKCALRESLEKQREENTKLLLREKDREIERILENQRNNDRAKERVENEGGGCAIM